MTCLLRTYVYMYTHYSPLSLCPLAARCDIQHHYSAVTCFRTSFGMTEQLSLSLPTVPPQVSELATDDILAFISLPGRRCAFLPIYFSTVSSSAHILYTLHFDEFVPSWMIYISGGKYVGDSEAWDRNRQVQWTYRPHAAWMKRLYIMLSIEAELEGSLNATQPVFLMFCFTFVTKLIVLK